jgi:hypothetical protein
MTEPEAIYCSCGCGIVIGQPMEFVNGEWHILSIPPSRLLELYAIRHPDKEETNVA